MLHGVLSIAGLPAAAIVMLPSKDYVISLVLSHRKRCSMFYSLCLPL